MTIAMQPIYTQTASGSAASIFFNNIPQTFTDLQIVISARSTATAAVFPLYLEFNGITPTRSYTILQGTGSTAASYRGTGGMWTGYYPAASSTASTFGNQSIYIPNYSGSNFKSAIVDGVQENNGTASYQNLGALLWQSTAGISSVAIYESSGSGNFAANSTFTLYGITKG